MIHLGSTWKTVLRKAWSIRLIGIAILVQLAELVLPFFNYHIPPLYYTALSLVTLCAAIWSRIVVQRFVNEISQPST